MKRLLIFLFTSLSWQLYSLGPCGDRSYFRAFATLQCPTTSNHVMQCQEHIMFLRNWIFNTPGWNARKVSRRLNLRNEDILKFIAAKESAIAFLLQQNSNLPN